MTRPQGYKTFFVLNSRSYSRSLSSCSAELENNFEVIKLSEYILEHDSELEFVPEHVLKNIFCWIHKRYFDLLKKASWQFLLSVLACVSFVRRKTHIERHVKVSVCPTFSINVEKCRTYSCFYHNLFPNSILLFTLYMYGTLNFIF